MTNKQKLQFQINSVNYHRFNLWNDMSHNARRYAIDRILIIVHSEISDTIANNINSSRIKNNISQYLMTFYDKDK